MPKPFETLNIPRKSTPAAIGKYKIFKPTGEWIEVAANTVLEALEASGIKDAIKVERTLLSSIRIFDSNMLGVENPAAASGAAPTS